MARDLSRSGYTGTLNGGPARVLKQPPQMVAFGTTTVSAFTPHYINFTRTVGEDVTFSVDATRFEFSGKPFMIAATFANDSFTSAERSVWSYANAANSSCGWHFRISGVNNLVFGFIGISDNTWGRNIGDFNPHSYCAWHDGDNLLTLFIDGVQTNRFSATGVLASCSILSPFISIAKTNNAGQGEFGGGVSFLRIKKNVTSEVEAKKLAQLYYNMAVGRMSQ